MIIAPAFHPIALGCYPPFTYTFKTKKNLAQLKFSNPPPEVTGFGLCLPLVEKHCTASHRALPPALQRNCAEDTRWSSDCPLCLFIRLETSKINLWHQCSSAHEQTCDQWMTQSTSKPHWKLSVLLKAMKNAGL